MLFAGAGTADVETASQRRLRVCGTSKIKIYDHTAENQSASYACCSVSLVTSVKGKSSVDQSLELN
jgi:hypothetical protein